MTDRELRDLVAGDALRSKAIDDQLLRLEAQVEKTSKQVDKTSKEVDETSRIVNRVSKELGHLGNTFGRFTEGLFMPSLERILLKDFGMDTVAPRIQRRRNGSEVELDVLAFNNGEKNVAFVVEIKSKLGDDDIKKLLGTLKTFPKYFPEHKDKKLFGMLAAVNFSKEQKATVEKLGIYVVRIETMCSRLFRGKALSRRISD